MLKCSPSSSVDVFYPGGVRLAGVPAVQNQSFLEEMTKGTTRAVARAGGFRPDTRACCAVRHRPGPCPGWLSPAPRWRNSGRRAGFPESAVRRPAPVSHCAAGGVRHPGARSGAWRIVPPGAPWLAVRCSGNGGPDRDCRSCAPVCRRRFQPAFGAGNVLQEVQALCRTLAFKNPCPAPVGYQNPCVVHHKTVFPAIWKYLVGLFYILSDDQQDRASDFDARINP